MTRLRRVLKTRVDGIRQHYHVRIRPKLRPVKPKPRKDEQFTFVTRRWDVWRAYEVIQRDENEPRLIDVTGAFDILQKEIESGVDEEGHEWFRMRMGVRVNYDYAKDIDLDKADPIIVATMLVNGERNYIPIDGWHRIAKMEMEGITEFPAYFLTPEQSKEVEI